MGSGYAMEIKAVIAMRMIDADAVLRSLSDDLPYKDSVRRVLIQAPTVDAVQVVRCENCLYWVSGENECESWEWCKLLDRDMQPHAFCSFGERKENRATKED